MAMAEATMQIVAVIRADPATTAGSHRYGAMSVVQQTETAAGAGHAVLHVAVTHLHLQR